MIVGEFWGSYVIEDNCVEIEEGIGVGIVVLYIVGEVES